MSNQEDCHFCNLKSRVIKENKSAVVFLSNPRRTPGHFLVTPKRHIEKPWEMTKEERIDIFDLILSTQQKIVEKLGTGCDIKENYKPFLEESRYVVHHIHYHLVPRTYKDRIYQITEKNDAELFEDLSEAEESEMSKLLD